MLERARRRDEDAVAALYQRALPVIYRYVYARLRRPDLVDDVVAEVFVAMVESLPRLRGTHEAEFFAWLLQIAQARTADALNQATRLAMTSMPLPDPAFSSGEHGLPEPAAQDLASDPVAMQEWREVIIELGEALGSLTTEQQTVIIGRFLAGQSIEDLARALAKEPGAIRALQFRALGSLAERLGLSRRPRRSLNKGERS